MKLKHIYRNFDYAPERTYGFQFAWDWMPQKHAAFLRKPILTATYYGWKWGWFVRRNGRFIKAG